MKKLATLLLAVIMVFSLFACDNGDDTVNTYVGTIFGNKFTLKIDGDSATAINLHKETDDGVAMTVEMQLIGGKATVSGNNVSADFSKSVTYGLSFSFSGEGAEEFANAFKKSLLSGVSTDSDKKLVNDLFEGKTIRFDKSSILSKLFEGFVYVSAIVDNASGSALYTEARYENGRKVVYEYYESGAIKKETYYNADGAIDSVEEYEDKKPSNPSDDEMTGNKEDNGGETNQRPTDSKQDQNNNQQTPPATDDSSSTKTEDEKIPSSSSSDKTDDEHITDSDEEKDEENTVMGGGTTIGGIVIGGNGEVIVGGNGGTLNAGEGGGIDLSDGVLFYIQGTFFGTYSGMDAVLDLPASKNPTFSIKAVIEEGDTTIKQNILVKGGELIYCNSILAIVNFDVPDVKYYMTVELEGSGAEAYKQKMLSDLNSSGMSQTDIQLYKDALNGIEISFGKESSIYQGIKLPAIKFKLDINKARFESERFDIDEHQNQGNTSSGNKDIYDSLTNIGGTATKDPNAGSKDNSNN